MGGGEEDIGVYGGIHGEGNGRRRDPRRRDVRQVDDRVRALQRLDGLAVIGQIGPQHRHAQVAGWRDHVRGQHLVTVLQQVSHYGPAGPPAGARHADLRHLASPVRPNRSAQVSSSRRALSVSRSKLPLIGAATHAADLTSPGRDDGGLPRAAQGDHQDQAKTP
jgi:hypothetical protein